MKKSIGCFYSFDRTAIIKAEIKEDKIHLTGEFYTHIGIKEIGEKLKSFNNNSEIITNKHQILNSVFNDKLMQLDFKDDDSREELNDLYKSLENENLLVINKGIDMKLPHHKQALFLAIKGLDYYKEKYTISFGSIALNVNRNSFMEFN